MAAADAHPAGAPALLEREAPLALLGAAFERAAQGAGGLVLVGGEAGVGKTALVRAFTGALGGDARVLVGACEPLFTARPLGPVADVARPGGELERLTAGGARAHEVLTALLAELQREPTVLVLEDVHWADEATLDLLRLLGRRAAVPGVLVIVTFRDDELDPSHPLRVVLGGLASVHGVQRLALQPLSLDAVREITGAQPVDADELHRRTGGNAFFVTEVIGAGGGALPATVRDAVLARVARLGSPAKELLDAVAIIPGAADVQLLAQIAGADLSHLDECLASGVLRADGHTVRFRHELARRVVEESLAPNVRMALHAAALAALTAPPAGEPDHARLAHHAEAAGETVATRVHARMAARHASALGAHREAAAQWARALRCADDRLDGEVAELLELHAYECYLSNQIEEALEARRRALERYRGMGDRVREGDQWRWISRLSWFVTRNEEAEAAAIEAVALLEPCGDTRELAMAFSNMAQLRMLADDAAGAVAWGERAIALAERLGDGEIVAHALNNVGTADIVAGRGPDRLEESLARSLEGGLEEHVARAYTNLASLAVRRFRHDAAERHLSEGIAYCSERDLDSWRIYMLGWQAQLRLQQGRWDEAAAAATSALQGARTASASRVNALVVVGLLRARRGDPDPLVPLGEALALARQTGEAQRLAPVAAARAEAELLLGRPEAAAGEAAAVRLDEGGDPWHAGLLALWAARTGAPAGAPRTLPEPYALELAGDHAAAAAAWRALGCPYEAALAASWSDDEDDVRAAHGELVRLGVAAAASMVSRIARERGVQGIARGPRRSTREAPAGLTAREAEILQLVAEGLRNREIAARLFLSPRTVDHHVAAIFRKLGVRTRVQASVAARGLGLTGTET